MSRFIDPVSDSYELAANGGQLSSALSDVHQHQNPASWSLGADPTRRQCHDLNIFDAPQKIS
jgi:hypothetical protein